MDSTVFLSKIQYPNLSLVRVYQNIDQSFKVSMKVSIYFMFTEKEKLQIIATISTTQSINDQYKSKNAHLDKGNKTCQRKYFLQHSDVVTTP